MRFYKSISLKKPGPCCQQCQHFQNDPAFIEATYPGLTTMSSGFASVRDQDGICNYHQLYLSARDTCPVFAPRESGANQAAAI